MNRKNIFDILSEQYDLYEELEKISEMFSNTFLCLSNPLHYNQKYLTMENLVEEQLFTDYPSLFVRWKQRGSCLNCAEMRKKLGVPKNALLEDKVITLEYFINIINLIQKNIDFGVTSGLYRDNNFTLLIQNIEIFLDKLNYEKHIFEDEEKVILVPKNPAATAVAEISSEDTALAILMYHHASLKGNLTRKKELLRQIAQEYEPLLKKGIDGFSDYFSKARDFLNNLDIRHNNGDSSIVKNLSPEELENWYDELYQLLLFCVLIRDNKDRKDKMAEFLKTSRQG